MKSRLEYEKICDKVFMLAGDAQAARIQVDLLLDIRELLLWMKEDTIYKQALEERKSITTIRETLY